MCHGALRAWWQTCRGSMGYPGISSAVFKCSHLGSHKLLYDSCMIQGGSTWKNWEATVEKGHCDKAWSLEENVQMDRQMGTEAGFEEMGRTKNGVIWILGLRAKLTFLLLLSFLV